MIFILDFELAHLLVCAVSIVVLVAIALFTSIWQFRLNRSNKCFWNNSPIWTLVILTSTIQAILTSFPLISFLTLLLSDTRESSVFQTVLSTSYSVGSELVIVLLVVLILYIAYCYNVQKTMIYGTVINSTIYTIILIIFGSLVVLSEFVSVISTLLVAIKGLTTGAVYVYTTASVLAFILCIIFISALIVHIRLRKERHMMCGEVSVESVLKKFTLVILLISLFGILLCLAKIAIHIVISVYFKMLIPYQNYIEINSDDRWINQHSNCCFAAYGYNCI
ncbi:hypothetical protein AKO1_015575 [Acrasis kona]|uniref:Uncharacterized protein n=1 Tax=Acrasis kona TaxID=1008807 RepID=A0AAW2ZGT5_9EUKA